MFWWSSWFYISDFSLCSWSLLEKNNIFRCCLSLQQLHGIICVPTNTFIWSNLCNFLVQAFNLTDPLFPNSPLEPLSEICVAFPVFQSYKFEAVLNENSWIIATKSCILEFCSNTLLFFTLWACYLPYCKHTSGGFWCGISFSLVCTLKKKRGGVGVCVCVSFSVGFISYESSSKCWLSGTSTLVDLQFLSSSEKHLFSCFLLFVSQTWLHYLLHIHCQPEFMVTSTPPHPFEYYYWFSQVYNFISENFLGFTI